MAVLRCKAELEHRAKGLDRCVVVGALDNAQLSDIYAGADLLVFPSTTETFGMVVLEAHACGLPAAVSDVGGPQEIVVDGATGHVLPARDTEAWCRVILEVLHQLQSDVVAHDTMRQAARRRAAEYDWNAVLDGLMEQRPHTKDSTSASSQRVRESLPS